jgi:Peptidase family M49
MHSAFYNLLFFADLKTKIKPMKEILSIIVSLFIFFSSSFAQTNELIAEGDMSQKIKEYKEVELKADLSQLSSNQKTMIKLLIEAAEIMDDLFWKQAYGDKNEILSKIKDPDLKRFVEINYGPWDRLNGNAPFIDGIGEKPKGAQFYPLDMEPGEFEKLKDEKKTSLYSVIRRNSTGDLKVIPYSSEYEDELKLVSNILIASSTYAEDKGFKYYLQLRAEDLLSDNYKASDRAWMIMKSNQIDVVIGPIENYEDQIYNYKASFEAYVLIKDLDWSEKLEKYTDYLPSLQKGLPVPEEYKKEIPGSNSDLNAYDVIYYAGDCNAGSKTIAINLPNDEEIQLAMGTRRLQLKNAMKAKFDEILVPIANVLIDPEQRGHITFDAFFSNTMFHEVAHGLGIKNTISGKSTVRKALKEKSSAIEEGKADILGLYMVTELAKNGELENTDLMDYYVTFLAGIFRSSRFGSTSAHGRANMIRFNYFKEKNAFSFDAEKGTYSVNPDEFQQAMTDLSKDLLILQGDGNYEGVNNLFKEYGFVGEDLKKDLDKINALGIPKDIVFKQGVEVLGLK